MNRQNGRKLTTISSCMRAEGTLDYRVLLSVSMPRNICCSALCCQIVYVNWQASEVSETLTGVYMSMRRGHRYVCPLKRGREPKRRHDALLHRMVMILLSYVSRSLAAMCKLPL